jgi:hypothetical protein
MASIYAKVNALESYEKGRGSPIVRNRQLTQDDCNNVRDLGGLHTHDGRVTRWGAVICSDTLAWLTVVGWSALYVDGIRTIVTLRTNGMVEGTLVVTPPYAAS